jgi:hypothetical protein
LLKDNLIPELWQISHLQEKLFIVQTLIPSRVLAQG